jgi:uncharacterized protein YgiM (DUF1202 family)
MKRLVFLLVILAACAPFPVTMEPAASPVSTPTLTPAKTKIPVSMESYCLIVTADQSLHLRTAPTMHSPALAWLEHGQRLHSTHMIGLWYYVEYEGQAGYIHSHYVTRCHVQKRYIR